MKKIISLFKRDYEGNRQVFDEVVEGAEWVLQGEGVATQKFDGTCAMIRGGLAYKRYDAKRGKTPPAGWEQAQDPDPVTGHWPGWLPVGDGPPDQWFREALTVDYYKGLKDGTYELCGPKVQGNPEQHPVHCFIKHGVIEFSDAPRTFVALKDWLTSRDIEGIVWHHPDGRMVKIKKRDFGLKR